MCVGDRACLGTGVEVTEQLAGTDSFLPPRGAHTARRHGKYLHPLSYLAGPLSQMKTLKDRLYTKQNALKMITNSC